MPISVGDSDPSVLVTLPDVYNQLNVAAADQTDALAAELQGFIDAATSVIQDITGPIIPTAYTEVHDGGADTIIVYNSPILSVASITEYIGPVGYTLTQAELGTTAGQYSFSIDNADQGIIRRRYSGGFVGNFAGGLANVIVNYTAGQSSVDPEIRMATLLDIQGLYSQTQYGAPSFGSGLNGDGKVDDEWTQAPMNLFPRLLSVLQTPKRRNIAIA